METLHPKGVLRLSHYTDIAASNMLLLSYQTDQTNLIYNYYDLYAFNGIPCMSNLSCQEGTIKYMHNSCILPVRGRTIMPCLSGA